MLPRDRTFWRYFTIGVVALYGLTFLVYAVYTLQFRVPYVIILGALLLLGALPSLLLVRVSRAVVKGAASGMLIAALIAFVPLVVIAGICSALVGSIGLPND